MKKLSLLCLTALILLQSQVLAFAEAAGGETKGILQFDGVPSWVGRVVILIILFILAIWPMTGDLKEYMAMKRSMRKRK